MQSLQRALAFQLSRLFVRSQAQVLRKLRILLHPLLRQLRRALARKRLRLLRSSLKRLVQRLLLSNFTQSDLKGYAVTHSLFLHFQHTVRDLRIVLILLNILICRKYIKNYKRIFKQGLDILKERCYTGKCYIMGCLLYTSCWERCQRGTMSACSRMMRMRILCWHTIWDRCGTGMNRRWCFTAAGLI